MPGYDQQFRLRFEQFEPRKDQTPDVPEGMRLWPDERGVQPKDMSWGYVDTPKGRAHVHAWDFIATTPTGERWLVPNYVMIAAVNPDKVLEAKNQTEPPEMVQPAEESPAQPLQHGNYKILRFFAYAHLSPEKQAMSRPFGELAQMVAKAGRDEVETIFALRKLLEAKDCAVRSVIPV